MACQNGNKERGKAQLRVFNDQLRFLGSLFTNPRKVGALAPSGKALANEMVSQVDVFSDAPVIELGPGTGPVTQALIDRGIAAERIIALEYDGDFANRLKRRFPQINVVKGDAYKLKDQVSDILGERKACAVISSLPLFNEPTEKRIALLKDAFSILCEDGPFVQFTYAPLSPLPREETNFRASVSEWILKNVPPARVWTYRAPL